MNPLAATVQRSILLFAACALLAAPASSRAQDATPVPARADSTAAPAPPPAPASAKPTGKTSARSARSARAPREKQAKAPREKKPRAPREKQVKTPRGKTAANADSTAAKPKKAPRVHEPEKPYAELRQADGIYAKHANWLSLRFGYAKRTGDLAGEGLVGYGVAYQRMLSSKYAFEAGVGHDILGHFGGQLDEAVPFTGEFQRHFKWNTAVRPFVGLGGGFYVRKEYRTGSDYNSSTSGGPHLSLGFTSALDPDHVIGVIVRVASIQGRKGIVNPTFGEEKATETLWTAKIGWGLVY